MKPAGAATASDNIKPMRVVCQQRWRWSAASLCLAFALPCHAQPVTVDDVLRAELPEYYSIREQMRYVVGLVNRLDAGDDPRLILDVIELQLRVSIDLGLSDKLEHLMNAAAQLGAATGDAARTASIDEQIARSLFFSGRDSAGIQASERALARQETLQVAGNHPDPTRLFRHLIDHAQLVSYMMRVDALVPVLKRAEKILPKVRNPSLASIEHDNFMAQVYLGLGDMDRAREILASMLERANQLGLHTWEADVQFLLAETYLAQANYVEAAALSRRAHSAYGQYDNRVGAAASLQQLAQIANASGSPALAYGYAQRAVQAFDQLDDTFAKADSRRELAFAAALMGNAAAARSLLTSALALRPENASANWTYSIARLRTRIALAENDAAAARLALQREDRLRELRQTERGLRHTQATRTLFEVGERELRLQLLQRDNDIRRLDNQRDEAQIALQRWWIVGGFLLFAMSLGAAGLLYLRSIALKRAAYTDS